MMKAKAKATKKKAPQVSKAAARAKSAGKAAKPAHAATPAGAADAAKGAGKPATAPETTVGWPGGIRQALEKKQSQAAWPGGGETWRHKTRH